MANNDLNVMLREHARNGLQSQLDAAVTNGDTESARKIAADLERLALSTAPKQPVFGDAEIRAELDKQPWFGVDPVKSARVLELGKHMDPKKFGSAEAFATALIKAVEGDASALAPGKKDGEGEENEDNEDDEDDQDEDAQDEDAQEDRKPPPRRRRSDAPSDGEAHGRASSRSRSGPWTSLSDAPPDVRKEIERTADKFAPKTKEGREQYIALALDGHYRAHKRNQGKK